MTISFTWYMIVPALLALTLHEAAHAVAAKWQGDETAWAEGRATLNPLKHIDLIGTIIVPALSMHLSGIPIGWAKTVPIVPLLFTRHGPSRGLVYVALAGPAANLVQAAAWALLFILNVVFLGYIWDAEGELAFEVISSTAYCGILVNVVFALFNLLPIPPLDGARVLLGLLPAGNALRTALVRFEPWALPAFAGLLCVVIAVWRFT